MNTTDDPKYRPQRTLEILWCYAIWVIQWRTKANGEVTENNIEEIL
jgi:hypothetical protein